MRHKISRETALKHPASCNDMASCNRNHGICLIYENRSGTQSHATHSHHATHAHSHIHRIHLLLHTSEPASTSLSIKRLPHLPILLPIHSNNSIFIKHSAKHISKCMSCLLALPMYGRRQCKDGVATFRTAPVYEAFKQKRQSTVSTYVCTLVSS